MALLTCVATELRLELANAMSTEYSLHAFPTYSTLVISLINPPYDTMGCASGNGDLGPAGCCRRTASSGSCSLDMFLSRGATDVMKMTQQMAATDPPQIQPAGAVWTMRG